MLIDSVITFARPHPKRLENGRDGPLLPHTEYKV